MLRSHLEPLAHRLVSAEALIGTVVEGLREAIVSFDTHGGIDSSNAAAASMFGLGTSRAAALDFRTLMPAPFLTGHDAQGKRELVDPPPVNQQVDATLLKKAGGRIAIEDSAAPIIANVLRETFSALRFG